MKNTKCGFTLAELLIVVAIIAVLVAIAIPIFTAQLEKSREATDAANIRSLYAEVMSEAITTGSDVNTDGSAKVALKQTQDGWQNTTFPESLGNLGVLDGSPSKGGSAWVEFKQDGAVVTIHFEGGSGSGGSGGSGESGGGTTGGGSQSNSSTAQSIGEKVVELIRGASNNTQVVITVKPDGSVSVDVTNGNANQADILSGLQSSGLISSDSTVEFDSNDTVYVNGYEIRIIKNNGNGNGNGGSIHISAIGG